MPQILACLLVFQCLGSARHFLGTRHLHWHPLASPRSPATPVGLSVLLLRLAAPGPCTWSVGSLRQHGWCSFTAGSRAPRMRHIFVVGGGDWWLKNQNRNSSSF